MQRCQGFATPSYRQGNWFKQKSNAGAPQCIGEPRGFTHLATINWLEQKSNAKNMPKNTNWPNKSLQLFIVSIAARVLARIFLQFPNKLKQTIR
jgi:hypothetical protein